MGKSLSKLFVYRNSDGSLGLLVTSICFFTGGIIGFFAVARLSSVSVEQLSTYLTSFWTCAGGGEVSAPALPALLWETLRWPFILLLLSGTAIGLLAIPALFAVRGFLFSFAVAAVIRVFGHFGSLLAFLLFGLTGLLSLPALFLLGTQRWNAARRIAVRPSEEGGGRMAGGRRELLSYGVCGALFGLCILLEYTAVPALVTAVSAGLSL